MKVGNVYKIKSMGEFEVTEIQNGYFVLSPLERHRHMSIKLSKKALDIMLNNGKAELKR